MHGSTYNKSWYSSVRSGVWVQSWLALLIILIVPFVAFHTMNQIPRTEWEVSLQFQKHQFRALWPQIRHRLFSYKTSVEFGSLTSICLKLRCESLPSPKFILKCGQATWSLGQINLNCHWVQAMTQPVVHRQLGLSKTRCWAEWARVPVSSRRSLYRFSHLASSLHTTGTQQTHEGEAGVGRPS